jgi:SAM-dependent methyltransferase
MNRSKTPPQDPGLIESLQAVAAQYPNDMKNQQLDDIPRIAFNICLVFRTLKNRAPDTLEICDIGGGVGLFAPGCVAHGIKRMVLIDDFRDGTTQCIASPVLELHRGLGITVLARDVLKAGISDLPGQFDAITSFDSMEHWHSSPKHLFQEVVEKLRPGGVFVLGVPNAVNARKRISVLIGRGNWSRMADWYDKEVFRGHVREPDVHDLRCIAQDMGLTRCKIYGRNWRGLSSYRRLFGPVILVLDHLLRLTPSLCADLYMVGHKP